MSVLIAVLALLGPRARATAPQTLGAPGFEERWLGAPRPEGRPTGETPHAERVDEDLFFPPPKPAVIGREQWVRAEANCEHLEENEVNDGDIEEDTEPRVRIAVHHSAAAVSLRELKLDEAGTRERVKELLCGIRKYHMGIVKTRLVGKGKRRREITVRVGGHDWADIGYHFIVDWRGNVWEGRKLEKIGAHVKFNNSGSIGIALLGNFESQKPTADQLRALKQLLGWLVYAGKIDPIGIQGHGDLAMEGRKTECPGRFLSRKSEDKRKFDEKTASPLRVIRERLKLVWTRVPHAQSEGIDFAALPDGAPTFE